MHLHTGLPPGLPAMKYEDGPACSFAPCAPSPRVPPVLRPGAGPRAAGVAAGGRVGAGDVGGCGGRGVPLTHHGAGAAQGLRAAQVRGCACGRMGAVGQAVAVAVAVQRRTV